MSEASSTGPVLWSVDERGVARVTLNRPEVYNAYNGELIAALLAAYDALGAKILARGGDHRQGQEFPGRRRRQLARRGAAIVAAGKPDAPRA